MLTESEKKELHYNDLSDELRDKIDCAFQSPYLSSALAIHIQKRALELELMQTPFTIRGESTLEVTAEGVANAIKEAVTARANTETALKVSKWLVEVAEDLEKLQSKLTVRESKDAERIMSGTAEEIRKNVKEKYKLQ